MSATPASPPAARGVEREAALERLRESVVALLRSERALRGRDQHGREGLTIAQIRVLMILAREQELPAGQLADATGVTAASMTQLAEALERLGLVKRVRSSHDRRVVNVALTAEGQRVAAERGERWRARWADELDGVSDAELRAAGEVLARVAGIFDAV